MRRRTTLIKSPLDWHMAAAPVQHPTLPVLAEGGGTQLRTPRATVLVDTREQNPFDFSRFEGWFAGVEKKGLKLGTTRSRSWRTYVWWSARSVRPCAFFHRRAPSLRQSPAPDERVSSLAIPVCLNPRGGKIRYNRSLMWHGMCLFLVGLLTGFGEHRCRNARSSMRWFWLIPTASRRSRLLPAQSGKCHSRHLPEARQVLFVCWRNAHGRKVGLGSRATVPPPG
jgi:hypothetical protein